MKETQKYQYIDALRGYAVLLVIGGHVSQLFPLQGVWATLIPKTAMGVQLFYVVSALTLTMSWTSKQDGVSSFYTRRLFRIAPLYWLAIIFYLALYGFGERSAAPSGISWTDVALNATFTHMLNPFAINSVVPGGWSIAVEMVFYLIFPILMLVIRDWKTAVVFVIVSYYTGKYSSAVLAQLYANSSYPNDFVQAWKFYILPSQISAFAMGILLYFAIQRFSRIKGRVFAYSIFTAATLALFCTFRFLQYGGPIAVLIYSFTFSLYALSFSTGHFSSIINKPIQKLGALSFSAYLVHFSVIHLLKEYGIVSLLLQYNEFAAFCVLLILVLSATVLASYFTHRFIETPGIQCGNFLVRRLKNASSRTTLHKV